MQPASVALFGQAAKGEHNTLYRCNSIEELFSYFGEPPSDSEGIFHAIQTLLYGRSLLYYRVHEEGMSINDYLQGLHLLRDPSNKVPAIGALFLPRIGVEEVIEEGIQVCKLHKSLLFIKESDLYDYLTEQPNQRKNNVCF